MESYSTRDLRSTLQITFFSTDHNTNHHQQLAVVSAEIRFTTDPVAHLGVENYIDLVQMFTFRGTNRKRRRC